jgi:hypothetical protein
MPSGGYEAEDLAQQQFDAYLAGRAGWFATDADHSETYRAGLIMLIGTVVSGSAGVQRDIDLVFVARPRWTDLADCRREGVLDA